MKSLSIIKYIIFAIATLILLLVWKGIFILQGGIGYQENIVLLPIKLLPIFLYTSFAFWLTLKMFDYKKKITKRKNISFAVGGLAVVVSLCFQYFAISKRVEPFTFKNNMFSHLKPIEVNQNFRNRMTISSTEYARLMPFGSVESDLISFLDNIAAEAFFIFELKKLVTDENIENTCKQYLQNHNTYGNCIIDLQKDIHSSYQFSSTGNILLVTVGALGTFKIKTLLTKKQGKEDKYLIMIKSTNDMIETSMLSAERAKLIVVNNNRPIKFTMGHEMNPDSILSPFERQINYKYLSVVVDRIGGLITSSQKSIADNDSLYPERKISSVEKSKLLGFEKKRFEKLKAHYLSFQNDGFKLNEIKLKLKNTEREMEVKLEQLKEQSFLFKVSAFFNPSLNDLTIDDFMKK